MGFLDCHIQNWNEIVNCVNCSRKCYKLYVAPLVKDYLEDNDRFSCKTEASNRVCTVDGLKVLLFSLVNKIVVLPKMHQ